MPAVDALTLRFGPSSRLRVIQFVAAFLGAAAIMVTGSDLVWKLGAWSALVFVTGWAQTASIRKNRSGWFELLHDGTAHMKFHDGTQSRAVLMENAWAIRWLCVLAFFEPESGRHYHCVVCAAENSSDDYRRLRRQLNMRSPAENLQKAKLW